MNKAFGRRKFIEMSGAGLALAGFSTSLKAFKSQNERKETFKKTCTRIPPTAEEYKAYRERFCNWGRWGKEDQLGTLNFITEETVNGKLNSYCNGKQFSYGNGKQKSHQDGK